RLHSHREPPRARFRGTVRLTHLIRCPVRREPGPSGRLPVPLLRRGTRGGRTGNLEDARLDDRAHTEWRGWIAFAGPCGRVVGWMNSRAVANANTERQTRRGT